MLLLIVLRLPRHLAVLTPAASSSSPVYRGKTRARVSSIPTPLRAHTHHSVGVRARRRERHSVRHSATVNQQSNSARDHQRLQRERIRGRSPTATASAPPFDVDWIPPHYPHCPMRLDPASLPSLPRCCRPVMAVCVAVAALQVSSPSTVVSASASSASACTACSNCCTFIGEDSSFRTCSASAFSRAFSRGSCCASLTSCSPGSSRLTLLSASASSPTEVADDADGIAVDRVRAARSDFALTSSFTSFSLRPLRVFAGSGAVALGPFRFRIPSVQTETNALALALCNGAGTPILIKSVL